MWKNLSLVIFALLLALGIGEVLVAVTGVAPEVAVISVGRYRFSANPSIGYEPVPHYEGSGRTTWFMTFNDRSNNLGFRDRDHDVRRIEDTRRILILGDSVTMGIGIKSPEEIYSSVLERELRAAGKNVEVLNFGVAGYNTQQEVAMLIEKGLVFDPDIVVLQYCLNDREEVNGGVLRKLRRTEKHATGTESNLLVPVLNRSALYRFLHHHVLAEASRLRRDESLERLGEDTVEESFALLARTARKEDIEVLVVVFPFFMRGGEVKPEAADAEEHRTIAGYSAANGLRHLDLASVFRECAAAAPGEPVASDRIHPTPRGHACAATAIAECLLKDGLL
jgi:lysophospholipase L1-like esterase